MQCSCELFQMPAQAHVRLRGPDVPRKMLRHLATLRGSCKGVRRYLPYCARTTCHPAKAYKALPNYPLRIAMLHRDWRSRQKRVRASRPVGAHRLKDTWREFAQEYPLAGSFQAHLDTAFFAL